MVPVLLGKLPATDWHPVLGIVKATCQPNVTEIRDWLRPCEPYGSRKDKLDNRTVEQKLKNSDPIFLRTMRENTSMGSVIHTFLAVDFNRTVKYVDLFEGVRSVTHFVDFRVTKLILWLYVFVHFYQKKFFFLFLRNQDILCFLCVLDPGDHFTKKTWKIKIGDEPKGQMT